MQSDKEDYIEILFGNDPRQGSDYFFTHEWDKKSVRMETKLSNNAKLELDFLHYAFKEHGAWVDRFSPAQIALGLNVIFNPSFGNLGFCFREDSIDEHKAMETVSSLGDILLNVFETTAPAKLGHLSGITDKEENQIISLFIYMFWDTASIPHKCSENIRKSCFEVMKRCTRSSNIALVESGLHGLGHAVQEYGKERLKPYFSQANLIGGPQLRAYAQNAMFGNIQ